MVNALVSLVFVLIAGCSSAPPPPPISLTGDVDPVNFQITPFRNTVIKSQQAQGHWHKQFVYTIDCCPSPEFFYVLAHADIIIATIKPPFINFVFKKLQADLRRYGITTPVKPFVAESTDHHPQVILDCIKLSKE